MNFCAKIVPAETINGGHDRKTNIRLFGHHFAAIAAASLALLGPVIAAQFNYMPEYS